MHSGTSPKNRNPWDVLYGASVLITGATGLIGRTLVYRLEEINRLYDANIHVFALVRSIKKAERYFQPSASLDIVQGDLMHDVILPEGIDYIVHAASQTSSIGFIEHPVETSELALNGMRQLLSYALEHSIKGFVFLSSMEVYGFPEKGHKVKESDVGCFDVQSARSCYPLSKLMCESLCFSYHVEYGIPVIVLRLTQTFGEGVTYEDGRVFAEFARCAIEKRDIVLNTTGETERSYLYSKDAVEAIGFALKHGVSGSAYNVANEKTYCSIVQMAEQVAQEYGIQVQIRPQDSLNLGYANTLYMDLDTSAMKNLGWIPTKNLLQMYDALIQDMRCTRNKG